MGNKRKFAFEINDNGCFVVTSHKSRDPQKTVCTSKKGRKMTIPRYIYEECFGEIPEGMVVRHKCDNHTCINPEHMEKGTQYQNIQDTVKRGRTARGEKNASAKLKAEDVLKIKKLQGIEPISRVAERYEVSEKHIWRIWTGENWGYLTEVSKCYAE